MPVSLGLLPGAVADAALTETLIARYPAVLRLDARGPMLLGRGLRGSSPVRTAAAAKASR